MGRSEPDCKDCVDESEAQLIQIAGGLGINLVFNAGWSVQSTNWLKIIYMKRH